MSGPGSTVGLLVIVVLYASVGVLAARGSIAVTNRLFAPRREQLFYGLLLAAIAALYLAFTAYFGAEGAWRSEGTAVGLFAAVGLAGTRWPAALFVGYPLHGLWDLLHEWLLHARTLAIDPGQLTPVPLGYGVLCLAFDVAIALYALQRAAAWTGDRSTLPEG